MEIKKNWKKIKEDRNKQGRKGKKSHEKEKECEMEKEWRKFAVQGVNNIWKNMRNEKRKNTREIYKTINERKKKKKGENGARKNMIRNSPRQESKEELYSGISIGREKKK